MDGLGNINWWGFSPAIDFQEITNPLDNNNNNNDLNILVTGAGDPRHLLKTFANRLKHTNKKKLVRFYIYDCRLELYARTMLLLGIALESPNKRGIQEKTELFMEIFGNLNIRDQTAQYICTVSNELIKYLTDSDHLKKANLGCFDFSLLKFKERDFLEAIFKYWRMDYLNTNVFPTKTCWDLRLRAYFKTRYDTRSNAFDWDFAMKLTERPNGAMIHNKIYSYWRDNGNAFELRDANYNSPNLTLASTNVFDNPNSLDKSIRRGYFGDVVIGPFVCYGVESENKEFFKKANDQYRYTSVDVTKANVTSLMESILVQKGLKVETVVDERLSRNLNELTIEEVNEDTIEVDFNAPEVSDDGEYLDFADNVQFIFLPLTAFDQELMNKSRFENHFDLVYFSNYGFKYFNMNLLKKILKRNVETSVVFETAKYMIELDNEKVNVFSQHLIQTANENKFKCFNNEAYSVNKEVPVGEKKMPVETNDYFKFVYVNKD
jgi:dynein assembly factor 3